jgi:hypothetical protein
VYVGRTTQLNRVAFYVTSQTWYDACIYLEPRIRLKPFTIHNVADAAEFMRWPFLVLPQKNNNHYMPVPYHQLCCIIRLAQHLGCCAIYGCLALKLEWLSDSQNLGANLQITKVTVMPALATKGSVAAPDQASIKSTLLDVQTVTQPMLLPLLIIGRRHQHVLPARYMLVLLLHQRGIPRRPLHPSRRCHHHCQPAALCISCYMNAHSNEACLHIPSTPKLHRTSPTVPKLG